MKVRIKLGWPTPNSLEEGEVEEEKFVLHLLTVNNKFDFDTYAENHFKLIIIVL